MAETITEECRGGLLPEFGFYAGAGAGSGGSAKVCPGANQNFRGAIKISVVMLVVVKRNGLNCNMFSDQC